MWGLTINQKIDGMASTKDIVTHQDIAEGSAKGGRSHYDKKGHLALSKALFV